MTVVTFAFRLFVQADPFFMYGFALSLLHFKLIVPAIRHSFLAQYDIYNVATGRLVN